MSRNQYTREFKIEAVQLSEKWDKPIIEVANELGIHLTTRLLEEESLILELAEYGLEASR
jgi:transposase-like protein